MLYFTVGLFVDMLVTVLYFNTNEVRSLITRVLEIYELEHKESTYMDNNSFDFYIHLINEIMNTKASIHDKTTMDSFLLKFKSDPEIIKDPELYGTLKNVFTEKDDISEDRYKYLIRKLTNTILWYENTRVVKKMFAKLSGGATISSPDKQEEVLKEISSLSTDLIKYNENVGKEKEDDQGNTRLVDFGDKDMITKALEDFNKTSVVNVFKTGLQGMNRSFGKMNGFPMGSSIVFNSISGQGKSLILLKFARWAVTINKVSENIKKPTCIFYSLENEIPQNLMQLFNELYVNKFKQVPPRSMPYDQIVEFCYNEFAKYGWKLFMERRLGAEFGYMELVSSMENYISAGYTPMMCIIDYMNMMKKGTNLRDDGGGNHLLLRDLYTNVCNYCKSKNCTLVTAHQLNRKAAEVVRINKLGAVKKFGIDMLADGMDPQREIDIAFYQHKEVDTAGRAFLTWKLDKHRYVSDTPDKDKYFAYLFKGELGILDDIDGEDMSTTNIYAYPFDEEDGTKEGENKNAVAAIDTLI